MDTSCLFAAALQLQSPWKVGSVDFRDAGDGRQELHIMIGFEPGALPLPRDGLPGGGACPVHDTRERMWRHLNFFQYKASFGLTPVVPPKKNRTAPWDYDREAYKGAEHGRTRVFDRMKHYRKAATRHDRLDETFLANLQLILIAIYLKKHSQKPN